MNDFYQKMFDQLDWLKEKEKTLQKEAKSQRFREAVLSLQGEELKQALQEVGCKQELIDFCLENRHMIASYVRELQYCKEYQKRRREKKLKS